MEPLGIMDDISWYYSREFVEQIDPHIVMVHEDSNHEGNIFIMRFINGFGVKILQLRLDTPQPSLFVVMVLKFNGVKMKDYHLAQYSPVPEVNWVNGQEEIIKLCRNVADLPAYRR